MSKKNKNMNYLTR